MDKAIEILKKAQGNVAVGVSGGADSMCLISLVLSVFKARCVMVIHIDHNLRKTSIRDKELVESYCKKHGLAFKVYSVDILQRCKESGNSVETEARQYRREIFFEHCRAHNASLILGHNLNDQAETILMHIFRGCGIDGLRGMSETDIVNGIRIFRPLIYCGKQEIYDYNRANDVPYFEDETNADVNYTRNFVRSLMTQIESRYPNVLGSLSRLGTLAAKAQDCIYGTLNKDYIKQLKGAVALDKRALKDNLASYYIIRAAKLAGLTHDFDFVHVEAIAALAGLQVGKRLNLPHNMVVYNERDCLQLCFAQPICQKEAAFVEGITELDGRKIHAKSCMATVQSGKLIVDADKLNGAIIRFRREGDVFKPCGGKTKKLKQYLSEKHTPNRLKNSIPLICRGNEVLVIMGMEISDYVKITKETRRALCLYESEGDNVFD